jgi:hypothetical protein
VINSRETTLKSKSIWKSPSRFDGVMNALLLVLAVGVFGLSVWEVEWNPGSMAATAQYQA